MTLTLRQVYNLVQRSNPEMLDQPIYTGDTSDAWEAESVEFWWRDEDGVVMNDADKEDAICDADYPMQYANSLKKVVVLS